MLNNMGYQTGIDLDRLCSAGEFIAEALGRELPGPLPQVLARRPRPS
jgi:hypothetical protein